MTEHEQQMPEIVMDATTMYREETYTDRRIGTLRQLTPVDADGNTDEARPIIYSGQTQLMTPAGPLPLAFDIEAESFKEAIERFGPAAEAALESTMEELQEMRRQQASSIVVPGQGGGMGGMGGPGGVGGPAGGGIQIP